MASDKKEEFTLQMFDGTNYDKWKFRLNLYLEMKDCQEVIQHESKPSEIEDDAWRKKEIRAKNYIVNSITNTQLELIISENTAKQMIDKLDETYLMKNSAMKLLCKRRLLDLKMKESENPTDFFNEFEKHINALKNAGEIVSNDDKLNYFLLALPESLTHVVDIVDALPPSDRTVEYVKSKLKLEFQKKESKSSGYKGNFQAFNSHAWKIKLVRTSKQNLIQEIIIKEDIKTIK